MVGDLLPNKKEVNWRSGKGKKRLLPERKDSLKKMDIV